MLYITVIILALTSGVNLESHRMSRVLVTGCNFGNLRKRTSELPCMTAVYKCMHQIFGAQQVPFSMTCRRERVLIFLE
jgi:hypothetical protein